MDYSIFLHPLIGAGIGYITNYIAVKMLFRPQKPIYIGKFRLPFTPGIIPKNKNRISIGIANVISTTMLNEENLKLTLLSDDIKNTLKNNINNFIKNPTSNFSLEEILLNNIGKENFTIGINNLKEHIANSIFETVQKNNLGAIVSNNILDSSKDNLKGSILSIFGGNTILNNISKNIENSLNSYIDKNGKEIIYNMVSDEINKYLKMNNNDLNALLESSQIDISELIYNCYEKFILSKLTSMLKSINLAKIIQDKIDNMNVQELEKIILLVMKKELNALVNLGAIIGLLLGIVNIFI